MLYETNEQIVATAHDVRVDNGTLALDVGRVVTANQQRELALTMLGFGGAREIIPPNVLIHDTDFMVWHVAGCVRSMHFRENQKVTIFQVPYPSLLFVASGNGLSVYGLATDERPTKDTPLYHAPLMNIYADARLCLGSARLPDGLGISDIPAWEELIFNTAYSHTNHDRTLRIGRKKSTSSAEHFKFYQKLAKGKPARFPIEALIPLNKTVGDLL